MVEQQIRPWDVLAPRVLAAFAKIAREEFVTEAQKPLAYMDIQLPIGDGEKMLEPKVEGRMLQALDIEPTDKVLEVGTGSGFVTALLAYLGKEVLTVEINKELLEFGQENLARADITNINFKNADAIDPDFKIPSTYDVIVLTGSVREIPEHLTQALNPGGRMFAMLEQNTIALAVRILRQTESEFITEELFETIPLPLKEKPKAKVFDF